MDGDRRRWGEKSDDWCECDVKRKRRRSVQKTKPGDTHNKSQIWIDAPHCRVPTRYAARLHAPHTPVTSSWQSEGRCVLPADWMAGYSDAKHACEIVSFHIRKVTYWGRAIFLHFERQKQKNWYRKKAQRHKETDKEMWIKQVSHHQTVKTTQSLNVFLITKHLLSSFCCGTTVQGRLIITLEGYINSITLFCCTSLRTNAHIFI